MPTPRDAQLFVAQLDALEATFFVVPGGVVCIAHAATSVCQACATAWGDAALLAARKAGYERDVADAEISRTSIVVSAAQDRLREAYAIYFAAVAAPADGTRSIATEDAIHAVIAADAAVVAAKAQHETARARAALLAARALAATARKAGR